MPRGRHPIHWLIILVIIVLLFGGKRIPEILRQLGANMRNGGDGGNGGSPQHPLPVSGPVETKGNRKVNESDPKSRKVVFSESGRAKFPLWRESHLSDWYVYAA
jgi:TatA/E family protein of Tat protein translocase